MAENKNNYFFLLTGLLLFVILAPLADEWSVVYRQLLFTLPLSATLILGVWSLPKNATVLGVGWVLAAASATLSAWHAISPGDALVPLSLLVGMAFFGLTIAIALGDVMFGGTVDANRLAGASCIYLLLGIFWGFLFFFMEFFEPGSFRGLDPEQSPTLELVYFSFVTLTTLGYGEISPVEPLARALAYLEAVVGVMYTTLLVAALVGAHLSSRRDEREPPA